MRRTTFLALGLLLSLAPATAVLAQSKGTIGIAMPTKSSQRWIADGENMVKAFKALGYNTDLQYADDEIPVQLSQVENMVTKGVKALVIASIDGSTLSSTLKKAAEKGVKVIAYDRLIRGSANVDYYATFDNFQVGVLQANSIVDKLGLKQGKGPFNIEVFAGSPDDNNSGFFYDGAMKVGILRWDGSVAQSRMDNLMSAFYGKEKLHAVLAPADVLSIGIISSLKGVGYGTASQPMPVITGQDADLSSVKAILRGDQTSTVFKDTRQLAKVTADLVDAALSGKTPQVNDTKTYNNGVKVVPSYLLKPVAVDATNLKAVLVDSGYYKESQLK